MAEKTVQRRVEKLGSATVQALSGTSSRRGLSRLLPFLGPAFIASIAYVDPGNFATNIQGGAQFGYLLLWVVVASNLMAMLIQTLSAKLGIATGHNLAELCRMQYPKPVVWVMWVLMELVAMATDLAEFLGAALGFKKLAPGSDQAIQLKFMLNDLFLPRIIRLGDLFGGQNHYSKLPSHFQGIAFVSAIAAFSSSARSEPVRPYPAMDSFN